MKKENLSNTAIVNEVHWENGLTYSEYRQLIDTLLQINQTTGANHSEKMLGYTRLNVQRMNKWDKIITIDKDLKGLVKAINKKQNWLIITEAWCGDASQNIPVIQKVADLNSNITVRYLLRDENLDIMDAYLTDGARSIPKLIIMDEDLNALTHWGPRPSPAQKMLKEYKANPEMSHDEFAVLLHAWYGKDRGVTLMSELKRILSAFVN